MEPLPTFVVFKKRWQLLVRKPTFRTEYRFRLVATNGEVIAQSEGYTAKHNVIGLYRRYFEYGFELVDETGEA